MDAATGKLKVLVTGAYGLIGNLVYAHLAAQSETYDAYGMVRRTRPSSRAVARSIFEIPAGRLRLAELTDLPAVQRRGRGDRRGCPHGGQSELQRRMG